MFRFRFDLEDTFADAVHEQGHTPPTQQTASGASFSEIELDLLLVALPTKLSYSFVSVPSPDGNAPDLKLARRDLFDARFQLISEGVDDSGSAADYDANPSFASALQFIDNPSDLVPLVYEGGLKTWECSLDLASCLRRDGHAARAKGQRVLELGCGTALPTLCILQEIFSSPPADNAETHVHLQDYNASVLQLATLPNVVLAWYTSPAAATYRSSAAHSTGDVDSELQVTPELIGAFKMSLRNHGVCLRFFSGSWDTFDLSHTGGPYHLVLTSETIYRPDSLSSLVRVMRDACSESYCCLVAAKTIYFGVGGGIAEFVQCVESIVGEKGESGRVETIWEKSTGVCRKVLRVRWRGD